MSCILLPTFTSYFLLPQYWNHFPIYWTIPSTSPIAWLTSSTLDHYRITGEVMRSPCGQQWRGSPPRTVPQERYQFIRLPIAMSPRLRWALQTMTSRHSYHCGLAPMLTNHFASNIVFSLVTFRLQSIESTRLHLQSCWFWPVQTAIWSNPGFFPSRNSMCSIGL